MRAVLGITLMVGALLFLSTTPVIADEAESVEKSDLPEIVLKAFQKSFPGIEITGYDKEVVNGKTQYEIETETEKMEKDYIYSEDGALLHTDEEISVKSLPDPVVKSIMKAHPNCEIDEAERVTRGEAVEFEVVIEVDEKEFELLLSSEGKVLASEEMENEEDDEDEEDDDKDHDDNDADDDRDDDEDDEEDND